ncbi:hypothetical protein J6590_017894 [Homalodisca vitripennis]|nr:hypothetical protein J6590_017894 [Homalodisca vitripennis]
MTGKRTVGPRHKTAGSISYLLLMGWTVGPRSRPGTHCPTHGCRHGLTVLPCRKVTSATLVKLGVDLQSYNHLQTCHRRAGNSLLRRCFVKYISLLRMFVIMMHLLPPYLLLSPNIHLNVYFGQKKTFPLIASN